MPARRGRWRPAVGFAVRDMRTGKAIVAVAAGRLDREQPASRRFDEVGAGGLGGDA